MSRQVFIRKQTLFSSFILLVIAHVLTFLPQAEALKGTLNTLTRNEQIKSISSFGQYEAPMSYMGPENNVARLSSEDRKHNLGGRRNGSPSKESGTRARSKSGSSSSNRTALRRATVRRIVHPSLYAVWDEYNHLCVLAKFQATFTIKYETISGTSQLIDKMPANARNRGRCDQFDEEPVVDIMWKDSQLSGGTSQQQNNTGGFTFRIIFQKYPEDGQWGIQQMQLLYNTGHPVFRGAISPKKFIVRSNKDDHRLNFRTNLAHSLLCPSPPPIRMYDSDGNVLVIARLANMHLQAFEFSEDRLGDNYDVFERCGQVSFGSGVAKHLNTMKSEGLTFAIGTMTVFIATLTVVGYAIYRSNANKTKEYKQMQG